MVRGIKSGTLRGFLRPPATRSAAQSASDLTRFALLGAALIGLGCSGQQPPANPTLDFSGQPALTVASASGALNLAVWWSPAHPTVGYDATQLAITDSAGAPVSGLTLTIVPWMPAHGHGASVEPAVTETAPGTYVATPLDFFMSGTWQLRTTIVSGSDGGAGDAAGAGDAGPGTAPEAIDDSAQPTVDVP